MGLTQPIITVIIPTFDDWVRLKLCLQCLENQDIDPQDVEIIVANNNADDTLPDGFDVAENVRFIWVQKPGSYAARNAAVAVAQGEFIFFTDSDCLPANNWLSTGLAVFQADPTVIRCAGGIELFPTSGTWNACALFDALFCLQQQTFAQTGRAATANLATRRSAFDVIGSFRETSFSGGDMEWGARARAAGLSQQYVPSMVVRHPARDRLAPHVQKKRRKTGARFIEEAKTHPIRRHIPPLRHIIPSVRAFRTALSARDHSLRLRMGAWAVHSYLRWVNIVEILSLSWLSTKTERK